MKQLLAIAGLGLALAGCMTPYGWSEAPLDDRHYLPAAPVGWWGRDVASVDVFYGSLAGHGNWGVHPRYGRVFLPAGVGAGWQPYSRGHWRQDPRLGRMWVSSEPWGWATYHYGRWGRDPRFGWFWVPDTRFGPGWVDWRQGGGFASWSPLPPMGWNQWGYGFGNDWWVHAPGAWAWRPGLHSHIRPGRHDWNGHDWNGRGWNGRDRRDRDWRDRDSAADRTPPRSPVRIPESARPDAAADPAEGPPAWRGRGRLRDDGERPDLVRQQRPGFARRQQPAYVRQEPPVAVSPAAGAPAPPVARPQTGNASAGFVRSRLQPPPTAGSAERATERPAAAPRAPSANRGREGSGPRFRRAPDGTRSNAN